jgi:polar amino acid transport system substrate-binding protein
VQRKSGKALIAFAVLTLVIATACAKSKTKTEGGPTPSPGLKTLIAGKIQIGTDMPYAPFESLDSKGDPVGFDVDLFDEVARRLGYKTVWYNAVFDTIFTSVALGAKWDIVVSAVTGYAPKGTAAGDKVADRSKIVLFGKPYYSSIQSLTINTTKTPDLKTTDDLKSGDKVAVQSGTTGETWAQEHLQAKGIELKGFIKAPDMFLALDAGTVKGIINDLPVSVDAVKNKPDLKVVEQIETGEQYAYAYAKDNTAFRDAVDAQLVAIFDDGTYARILKKWFPDQELPSYAKPAPSSSP